MVEHEMALEPSSEKPTKGRHLDCRVPTNPKQIATGWCDLLPLPLAPGVNNHDRPVLLLAKTRAAAHLKVARNLILHAGGSDLAFALAMRDRNIRVFSDQRPLSLLPKRRSEHCDVGPPTQGTSASTIVWLPPKQHHPHFVFGHHRKRRRQGEENAVAKICRESGATVSTNIMVRELDIAQGNSDSQPSNFVKRNG